MFRGRSIRRRTRGRSSRAVSMIRRLNLLVLPTLALRWGKFGE
jgi:hypothetical protein